MIEIFNKISARQIKAIMKHQQWADIFDFLGLNGEKRWQEYRALSEFVEMRGIHRYALNHCNKLIQNISVDVVNEIPSNWFNYTRLDVDNETRKNYVKKIYEDWFKWETETKGFLEEQFKTLTENHKIADANKVNCLIEDVDQELKHLTRKLIEYKAVNYDLDYIMYCQPEMHEYYKQKTKELGVDIS